MQVQDNQVYEIIEDEKNDDFSDDSLFNITSWGADLSFRELITMYEENELEKPELQRNYVWEKYEASRFIESILMGLPVPSIFLAQVGKKKLIVDGYQRIMTVYDYVKGIFSKDGKVFKLSSSEKINKRWRGKAFAELDEDDRITIKSTTIHAIVFEQKTPKNDMSMYQIFERINSSGRTLRPQEIRNCIYQGSFNKLLISLNKNSCWRTLFGYEDAEPRMQDMEFILRFFALNSDSILNSRLTQISLKKVLNEFMSNVQNSSSQKINQYKSVFEKMINFLFENFGEHCFHNINNEDVYVARFHPTIFDAISIATAKALEVYTEEQLKISIVEDGHLNLLKDPEFKLFISERTTNIEHIRGRIKKALHYLYSIDNIL